MDIYFGINKKYWRKEIPEGATQVPHEALGRANPQARPGGLWGPWLASEADLPLHEGF